MILLLILVLSVLSMSSIAVMLRYPDRAVLRPVVAPHVVAPVLDDGYFDTRGLV